MPQQPESTSATSKPAQRERGHRGRRADQRLLVAVAVEQRASPPFGERQRRAPARARAAGTPRGGSSRPRPGAPRRCAGDRPTRRAASAGTRARAPRWARRGPPRAAAARRSTRRATCASSSMPLEMSGRPQHFLSTSSTRVAGRLQQLHRGPADLRRVVGHEGVVEEHARRRAAPSARRPAARRTSR